MEGELWFLDQIDDNPYQPRREYAGIEALAEDIRVNGLLQRPRGRVHPADPTRLQLQFGHRRLRAFLWLADRYPDESRWRALPIDVDDIPDRVMFDRVIAENAQRSDLSDIERARSIQQYIAEFHVSQAEAATAFNLKTQAAVSNLLRLLKLPAPVQDLVHEGVLPQRLARQLTVYAKVDEAGAVEMAQAVAGAVDNKDEAWESEARAFADQRRAGWLPQAPWKPEWPKEPIPMSVEIQAQGLAEIRACVGCEFNVGHRGNGSCLWKLCWGQKLAIKLKDEIAAAGKKLGVAVAQPGEKVSRIYSGGWQEKDMLRAVLRLKPGAPGHDSLRVYGLEREAYQERDLFGSGWVGLGTVNMRAVNAALPKKAVEKAERKAEEQKESYQDREKRKERERQAARAVCEALLDPVVARLAAHIPVGAVDLLAAVLKGNAWRAMDDFAGTYEKTPPARRRELLVRVLVCELGDYDKWNPKEKAVRDGAWKIAELLGVTLPEGWANESGTNKRMKAAKGAKPATQAVGAESSQAGGKKGK